MTDRDKVFLTVTLAILLACCVAVGLLAAANPLTVEWLGHPVAIPLESCPEEVTSCSPGIYAEFEVGLRADGVVVWRYVE